MTRALVIGGTRFIGRHLVTELLNSGYEVTLLNRGTHENPFAGHPDVEQFQGDRTSGATLDQAAETVDPSVVVDCVAYYPGEVRMATRAFSDVDAYVYISSGSAYGPDHIPKREGRHHWSRAPTNRLSTTVTRRTARERPRVTARCSRPPRRVSGR